MARLLRRLLLLALLGAAVAAAVRALRGQGRAASPSEDSDAGPRWPPMSPAADPAEPAAAPVKPETAAAAPSAPAKQPAPTKKAAAKAEVGAVTTKKAASDSKAGATAKSTATWSAAVDGSCPDGYPVKANSSGIYHVPGGQSYDRTIPERCYPDPRAAEADGYRAARR